MQENLPINESLCVYDAVCMDSADNVCAFPTSRLYISKEYVLAFLIASLISLFYHLAAAQVSE